MTTMWSMKTFAQWEVKWYSVNRVSSRIISQLELKPYYKSTANELGLPYCKTNRIILLVREKPYWYKCEELIILIWWLVLLSHVHMKIIITGRLKSQMNACDKKDSVQCALSMRCILIKALYILMPPHIQNATALPEVYIQQHDQLTQDYIQQDGVISPSSHAILVCHWIFITEWFLKAFDFQLL